MQSTDNNTTNIAETIAREMKTPMEIGSNESAHIKRIALPPNWTLKEQCDEPHLEAPLRKTATVNLTEADSFIDYINRHGEESISTIWCEANYTQGEVSFISILNDHGQETNQQAWRDHRATFNPKLSEEWARWFGKKQQPFSQAEFAAFIEDNLSDIASTESGATGAKMLEMALNFEAKQDMRFKSAIRLQSGAVQISFIENEDAGTVAQMEMFDRFSIGIPVFWGGDAYQIDARLRYRVRDGKVAFWYELIRPDKVLEHATKELIAVIREKTAAPFFFGNAFAR